LEKKKKKKREKDEKHEEKPFKQRHKPVLYKE
jgi:hypothetical protein